MKLKNKKTGDVIEVKLEMSNDLIKSMPIESFMGEPISLKILVENWQDYEPTKPLIKDEKIRKAIRAWAEATGIKYCAYDVFWKAFRFGNCTICFKDEYDFDELEDEGHYTITELCGEEDS